MEMGVGRAWEQAEIGMQRALDRANRETENWGGDAYGFFCAFARSVGRRFLTEEVVAEYTEQGHPQAPDLRAWGAIAVRAKKAGVVRRVGFEYSKISKCHSSPMSLWEAC